MAINSPEVEKLKQNNKVRKLIKILVDPRHEIRESAARALGEIGDERAVDPLVARLKNRDERRSVVIAVSDALARIGDPRAFDPLVSLLPRDYAARALAALGDKRAVEPLLRAMAETEHADDRIAAADALSALGWMPARDMDGARFHLWKHSDPGPADWDACAAIGEAAVPAIIDWFGSVFERGHYWLMKHGIDALDRARIAEPAVQGIRALAKIGGEDAAEFLSSLLRTAPFPSPDKLSQRDIENQAHWEAMSRGKMTAAPMEIMQAKRSAGYEEGTIRLYSWTANENLQAASREALKQLGIER